MSITSKVYSTFLYIWYSRTTAKDSLEFARALEQPGAGVDGTHDVVIDLVICTELVAAELAAILRLVKKFNGTRRRVCLLTNPTIKTKLLAAELDKVPNLVLYDDQQSFISEITGKKV